MRFDILMLEIHGPELAIQETVGVREAALSYLQCRIKGPSRFKDKILEVEGFIEQIGTKEDAPLRGARFRVDLGTEGGILRKVEFVIPWDSVGVKIEHASDTFFAKLILSEDDANAHKPGHTPRIPNKRLN